MQHPVGFIIVMVVQKWNFLTIVQNDGVPGQFSIMLNGLLTAGVIIMAISAPLRKHYYNATVHRSNGMVIALGLVLVH